MIKKVMLTAIAVMFLLSGMSFANENPAAVDAESAEKVVQAVQSTDAAPAVPEETVATKEATEEEAVVADASGVEKKEIAAKE